MMKTRKLRFVRLHDASPLAIAIILAISLNGAPASAVDTSFNVASGDWGAGASWDTGNAPTSVDNVNVENGGTAEITSNVDGQLVSINNGTVNHTAGTLTTTQWVNVGHGTAGGTGTYNLSAGATVNQGGGNLSLGQGDGLAAHGIFNNGGTYTGLGELIVGEDSFDTGSSGELNMTGGSITAGGQFAIGKLKQGVGEVNLSGGSISSAWLAVGGAEGGQEQATGTFNLSGTGDYSTAGAVRIGQTGTGTFNMSGGTFDQNGAGEWVRVGPEGATQSGVGEFNISGTADFTTNSNITLGLSPTGSGVGNQSGGTVNAVSIVLGDTGSYNLLGGNLNLVDTVINNLRDDNPTAQPGSFNIAGGTLTLTGDKTGDIDALIDGGILVGFGSGSNVVVSLEGGNTIVTAIPEAASITLAAIGAASMLCGWRRRRRV